MAFRYIIWLLTIVYCPYQGVGQGITNNDALITIYSGSAMTVQGSFLNNGDLDNQGTLSVTGDWMNADTYLSGTGWLVLNGDGSQSVAHNAQPIFALRFDGGGDKLIMTNLQITDSLHFINGKVIPQSDVVMEMLDGGYISGDSEDSYVNGPFYHNGIGNKWFPIGSELHYRPAELIGISGTDPLLGMEVGEPNPEPRIPLQLLAVSDTRYWRLIRGVGNYQGARVRLKLGNDENLGTVDDLSDIVVAATDALGDLFINLGQSDFLGNQLDGEVTSNLSADYEFYAIGVEGFAEERSLYIPNAFSPAAPDPEDQAIKVYGQEISENGFLFRIYNRWGEIVYQTDSFNEANTVGWRGTDDAEEELSLGVYHYTLTGTFISGNTFRRNGTITVIR